jgi:hypothetical protein
LRPWLPTIRRSQGRKSVGLGGFMLMSSPL